MSFFLLGANERIGNKNKVMKLSKLVDWSRVAEQLKGIHKNEVNPLGGPKSYNNLSMFKAILLSQWYSLSDTSLEEALRVRLDFMLLKLEKMFLITQHFADSEINSLIKDWTKYSLKKSIAS